MRGRELDLDQLLRVVEQHCCVADMLEHLDFGIEAVKRKLARAETAELITATRTGEVNVWELTDTGRERLRRGQPILGTRTSVPAGTVVE
jgi:DNA-binding transcriptional regulator PaaX